MVERITVTRLKLRDAGIQMKLAIKNARDEDIFRSCVNAYISSARSITMVMERESAPHPELLTWYKSQTTALGKEPLFRFFNDQRDHTIHKGVVQPASQTFVVTEYRETHVSDPSGNLKKEMGITIKADEMPIRPGDVINMQGPTAIYWTFPAAAEYFPGGSTNVFRLCEDYFVHLKTLVHEWLGERTRLGIGP
jgi:hypothetical protein